MADLERISNPGHKLGYLYRLHSAIIHRCYDSTHVSYKDYGARGVTMHMPWKVNMKLFVLALLNDIGERPTPQHSIDRVHNSLGYCPGNLRWATKVEQTVNRRPLKSNTGESGISHSIRNGRDWYKVSINSKYVGCTKTLESAIILRNNIQNACS